MYTICYDERQDGGDLVPIMEFDNYHTAIRKLQEIRSNGEYSPEELGNVGIWEGVEDWQFGPHKFRPPLSTFKPFKHNEEMLFEWCGSWSDPWLWYVDKEDNIAYAVGYYDIDEEDYETLHESIYDFGIPICL